MQCSRQVVPEPVPAAAPGYHGGDKHQPGCPPKTSVAADFAAGGGGGARGELPGAWPYATAIRIEGRIGTGVGGGKGCTAGVGGGNKANKKRTAPSFPTSVQTGPD